MWFVRCSIVACIHRALFECIKKISAEWANTLHRLLSEWYPYSKALFREIKKKANHLSVVGLSAEVRTRSQSAVVAVLLERPEQRLAEHLAAGCQQIALQPSEQETQS